jgi:hypothetical protein
MGGAYGNHFKAFISIFFDFYRGSDSTAATHPKQPCNFARTGRSCEKSPQKWAFYWGRERL